MNSIYIEAFSGLSGNMFLSAFSELLGDYDLLLDLPNKLHLHDAKVEIKDVDKNGINCKYVEVIDLNSENNKEESDTNHSHHHHSHDHGHSHNHHHDHGHNHEHNHDHSHGHNHVHRHLSDIQKIIDNAHISVNAKKIAHDIFLLIGKAESKIHNIPLESIHFHEISAVDSIIDIVGNAILIDKLNISKVYCTPVCTGFGIVKTDHGMLPVPAPATQELLKGIPIYPGTEEGEKVTPTGAAILKYLNANFEQQTSYIPAKTAYGPGKKNFKNANVVRISILEETSSIDQEEVSSYIQMETSIDDMSPEYLGIDFQNGLLDSGALDFSISHQLMKKGRYGISLSVLLTSKNLDNVANYILENTTTIGLRYYPVKRIELSRTNILKESDFGTIAVKKAVTPNKNIKTKPEYEDIKKIAKANDMSPFQILDKIKNEQ